MVYVNWRLTYGNYHDFGLKSYVLNNWGQIIFVTNHVIPATPPARAQVSQE